MFQETSYCQRELHKSNNNQEQLYYFNNNIIIIIVLIIILIIISCVWRLINDVHGSFAGVSSGGGRKMYSRFNLVV